MSVESNKSWIAIGRRHEQDISLVDAYEEVFEALTWTQERCPMPIADTIIFQRLSTQFYSFDWPQQRLLTVSNIHTPTQAVKQFLAMDEGNSISAVWLSEVKDAKGYVISAEYMTLNDLTHFFQAGESKKIGVLQRYVYPRPFRHVDEVAQEVIVRYQANMPVVVERRLGSHPLDGHMEHPTVCGNLFHPVATSGKVCARSLPFTAAECRYGQQGERLTDTEFVKACSVACNFIVGALQRYRHIVYEDTHGGAAGAAAVRPVSRMVAQFRQSFHDTQLYFLGVIALRHPADRYHGDVRYEFIKVPEEGTVYIQSPVSEGELTITPLSKLQTSLHQTAATSSTPSNKPAVPPGEPDATDAAADDNGDEDDPNRYSPHHRPADPDLFSCPNCDTVYHRDAFVRMEYQEIVEHYLSQCSKAHKKSLDVLMHHGSASAAAAGHEQHKHKAYHPPADGNKQHQDALGMYRGGTGLACGRPTSAAPRPSRPQTAGGASHRPMSAAPGGGGPSVSVQTATTFGGGSLTVPPTLVVAAARDVSAIPNVLARLNVPLAELIRKPVRLLRSVPLCADCATSFGATVAPSGTNGGAAAHERDLFGVGGGGGNPNPNAAHGVITSDAVSPTRSLSPYDRHAEAVKEKLAHAPPSCLKSDVIDQMVVTPLQEQHRWLRQGERLRYQSKLRDAASLVHEAHEHMTLNAVQEDAIRVEAMIDAFSTRTTMRVVSSAAVTADRPPPHMEDGKQEQQQPPAVKPHGPGSSSTNKDGTTEIDVLSTGPDVPLQVLLMNDLFYTVQQAIEQSDTRDGVSMAHDSSALKPLPRPTVVVPADELDRPATQHLLKATKKARGGRRAAWAALQACSTTFCDLSDEEKTLLVSVVGGDPTSLLIL